MGFPSEGLTGQYRNHLKDVKRFFDQTHYKKYWFWNLCSEISYDKSKFDNRVQNYGFLDHNPCELERILPFCQSVAGYLKQDPLHVAAIHCKAGKGRTGFLIACILLYMYPNKYKTSESALHLFAIKRTKKSSRCNYTKST